MYATDVQFAVDLRTCALTASDSVLAAKQHDSVAMTNGALVQSGEASSVHYSGKL
jgi:hypothetical protein